MIYVMSDWRIIFTDTREHALARGAVLFRRDDPVRFMYLVQSGSVALERAMADGTALTLHVATAGDALAEASLFADTYHCDAVARTDARVARLTRADFLTQLQRMPGAALSLIGTHAKEVQSQRARIEILRLRRVSDRLDAWLALNGAPEKGQWVRVADDIGVSQPALYRELARRRGKPGAC